MATKLHTSHVPSLDPPNLISSSDQSHPSHPTKQPNPNLKPKQKATPWLNPNTATPDSHEKRTPKMSQQIQTRATYRALLRELPRKSLKTPSPIHQSLRKTFRPEPSSTTTTTTTTSTSTSALPFSTPKTPEEIAIRVQEAEQLAQYARAQRSYCELLERYNPGMSMDEEEKIRLTARRVGFDLPALHTAEGKTE
ncbi:uncharacterized protein N7511_006797 [Penicillium nucicola]|uniref:uncharacterized protein n=1 Tax=Penicillium nucicola TaxID=1850975 RepID=UPI0025453864|nr:uncharacterized protein N7511_006797 [Penicillium nucicola]KAJ5758103.1 hypothetical protein N7511_006797 [Penicillium nucicola]